MAVKRNNRVKTKSIEQQFNGPEPIVVTEDNYIQALNWYNYMYEHDKAREWLLEYMKKNGFERSAIASVRRCPKYYVPTTIGWQARIMLNGNKLSEKSMDFFNQQLDRLYTVDASINASSEPVVDKPTISIQERVKAKADEVIAIAESEVIDSQRSMYDFLVKNEVNKPIAEHMRAYYISLYEEVMLDDPQIKEMFGSKLRAERKFWQTVVDDLDRLIQNKKATRTRKPRTKKAKSAVDIVKQMSYQKDSSQYKVVSIDPANIVGCQQLWTFNTKQRTLTRYDAIGPAGITVSRSSLKGFDSETSKTKKLRKPDVVIPSVLSAGKVQLRKILEQINAQEKTPSGRINSDTILLRAIK